MIPPIRIVALPVHRHAGGQMRRQNARRLRRIRSSIRAVAQQQDIEESGLKWMAEFSQRSPELFEILKNVTSFRAPTETFERKKHSISAAYATQRQT